MIKLQGNFTKHISVDDYMWPADNETANITPETVKFMLILEEWITWLKRKVDIHGMYRSKAYNAAVGGIESSNHLIPTSADLHIVGLSIDEERFVKYAKKWKSLCKKHGFVGEAGLYTWGIHLGIQTYNKAFFHWDSRSGKQINMPFKI